MSNRFLNKSLDTDEKKFVNSALTAPLRPLVSKNGNHCFRDIRIPCSDCIASLCVSQTSKNQCFVISPPPPPPELNGPNFCGLFATSLPTYVR